MATEVEIHSIAVARDNRTAVMSRLAALFNELEADRVTVGGDPEDMGTPFRARFRVLLADLPQEAE